MSGSVNRNQCKQCKQSKQCKQCTQSKQFSGATSISDGILFYSNDRQLKSTLKSLLKKSEVQLSLNWEWPKFCRFPKWPNLPTPSYLPKIHIAGAAWRQKKRRKWCEWDSPNLRAGVSEACRHQNRMFFFHWLWRVPYLIVGLPDYHEYHVIKITEKCTNVVGHTWLSPVSHHQDNRKMYQCCWSYLIITSITSPR